MKTKLKHCQKCKSNFVRLRLPEYSSLRTNGKIIRGYWVECFNCGNNGETKMSREEAIIAWNKRGKR